MQLCWFEVGFTRLAMYHLGLYEVLFFTGLLRFFGIHFGLFGVNWVRGIFPFGVVMWFLKWNSTNYGCSFVNFEARVEKAMVTCLIGPRHFVVFGSLIVVIQHEFYSVFFGLGYGFCW